MTVRAVEEHAASQWGEGGARYGMPVCLMYGQTDLECRPLVEPWRRTFSVGIGSPPPTSVLTIVGGTVVATVGMQIVVADPTVAIGPAEGTTR